MCALLAVIKGDTMTYRVPHSSPLTIGIFKMVRNRATAK